MSTSEERDWVRQGTPRDVDSEWNDEQSEYGTALSPAEWDDYTSEQSVPVDPPSQQVVPPPADQPEAAQHDADQPYSDQSAPETAYSDEPVGEPAQDPVAVAAAIPDDESYASEPTADYPELQDGQDDRAVQEPGAYDETAVEEPAYEEPAAEELPYEDPATDEPYDEDETRVSPAVAQADEAAATEHSDQWSDERRDDDQAHEDLGETQVVPAVADGSPAATAIAAGGAGAAAVAAGAAALPEGLYRAGSSSDQTAVIPDRNWEVDEAEARERELQQQLDAERRARNERLGVVATSPENELRSRDNSYKVSTDRFFSSLGLFVLRLVTAAILGVAAYQILTDVDGTTDFLSQTIIPEPRLVTWILGFTLAAMALLLVIGMLQRVVGFLLLALAVCSLIFVRWGSFSPFIAGREGFLGDKDLLLAGIGLLLVGTGGGLWGVDGAFRRARASARAEKEG